MTDTNPRVSTDEDGQTLDDFKAGNVRMVHFEAIDETAWYATIELNDGQIWQLHFGAHNSRARGYSRAEQIA